MATSPILGGGPQTVALSHELSGPRTVPMKVLCLGYGRTGTKSLRDQLLTLGFHHAYHTADAIRGNPFDCKLWLDLLEAKYDRGEKPRKEDFDKLLGHCRAVLDMPAACFTEELLEYYPDAKVILTIRDPESWARSQRNSILKADDSMLPVLLAFTARVLRMPDRWIYPMFVKIGQVLYDGDFEKNGIKSMQQHYEKVRSLVPPEKLLEYHVSDGWEPLCKFLNRSIPSEALPHMNRSDDSSQRTRQRLKSIAAGQLRRIVDLAAYLALTIVLGALIFMGLSNL